MAINLPLDMQSGVMRSGVSPTVFSDASNDSQPNINQNFIEGLIADILAAQDPSNYRYGGYVSQGGLDIGEPNRQVINATPEQIAEALSKSKDMATAVLGSTVGSNQMLDDAAMAAAQAASQAAADAAASGGGQEAETVDLGADTTANELLTGGLGDADTGGVADVNETWTYDKDTDSFISNTRGDVFPNRGNATLKDGGIYAVTPVLGTDGVTAENVVDTETNESVGVLNIDITTGLPSIIKTVDAGTAVSDTDTFGTAQDTLNTGQTLGVGGGDGVSTGGQDFETAKDTNNTGKTLTVGDTQTTATNGTNGTDGRDGADGTDGQDGRDGKDGKDGKDGMIGLFSRVINETPLTESILFPTKFTKLENVQQGMFEQFLRAAGGNR